MKSLIQRVSSASVTVGAETAGQIGEGLLVFLGYEKGDSLETARKSIDKIIRMRIFEDNAGKLRVKSCSDPVHKKGLYSANT